jgi:hypothetical protein
MDRFVVRGGAPGVREGAVKAPKKAKAKQVTLASLAKVQVLPHSTLNFGAEELATLKSRLEEADASQAQQLDALRVLSSLVISTADLQTSMLGRTVNRLAKSAPETQLSRMACNLVRACVGASTPACADVLACRWPSGAPRWTAPSRASSRALARLRTASPLRRARQLCSSTALRRLTPS